MAAKRADRVALVDEKPHRTKVGGVVWRVLSIGSTVIATKLATDAARSGWKVATGRNVPLRGDFDRERARDVVLFTALSSMLVSTARVAAERGAVAYYRRSTGHLPAAISEESVTPDDVKAHEKLVRRKARMEYRMQKAINRAGRP
jgi:hypothetical protein